MASRETPCRVSWGGNADNAGICLGERCRGISILRPNFCVLGQDRLSQALFLSLASFVFFSLSLLVLLDSVKVEAAAIV